MAVPGALSLRCGRAIVAAATLVLFATACSKSTAPAESDATWRSTGPLRADGRWLRDQQGRVVILHGLQLAHKTAPYYPPPASFTEDDVRLIREAGFNAVRLAWFWKGLEPERGKYDAAYLAQYARQARLIAAQGLFLMPEFHQDLYNEQTLGAGFPDWATFTDGLPAQPDTGALNLYNLAAGHGGVESVQPRSRTRLRQSVCQPRRHPERLRRRVAADRGSHATLPRTTGGLRSLQ